MSSLLQFHDATRARLPRRLLPYLAPLRCIPGLHVTLLDEDAWLEWTSDHEAILERLLPIAGLDLFAFRDGRWYRPGNHLPSFDLPKLHGVPLNNVLFPAATLPEPPGSELPPPVLIELVRCSQPQPTTALLTSPTALATWIDAVSLPRLHGMEAAVVGEYVLLVGRNLPSLPEGERFHGEVVFVPIGWRPEPYLSQGLLRQAILPGQEPARVLLRHGKTLVIALDAFGPITRAGVRTLTLQSP